MQANHNWNDICRVPYRTCEGVKSSLSLDGLVARCLSKRLGSEQTRNRWVRLTAERYGLEKTAGLHDSHPEMGLSRYVQRAALILLLKSEDAVFDTEEIKI